MSNKTPKQTKGKTQQSYGAAQITVLGGLDPASAILLAHHCAPLSYRSVEEKDYREATLVFYEVNSIVPFKDIFIEQYVFAAKNYAVK